MTWNETEHNFAEAWAVHAERDGKPWMCGWAKTEADAKAELERVSKNDEQAEETEYWVMQMTTEELESYKAAGVISADA
jgi:hypothetical protein